MADFNFDIIDPAEDVGQGSKSNFGVLIDKQLDRIQFFRTVGSSGMGYRPYIDGVSALFNTISAYLSEKEFKEFESIQSEFKNTIKRKEPGSRGWFLANHELEQVDKELRKVMLFLRKRGFLPNKRFIDSEQKLTDEG